MTSETRVCKKCGMEKGLEEFKSYTVGTQTRYKWECLECALNGPTGNRTCKKCGIEKPIEEFYLTIRDGRGSRSRKCLDCIREDGRNRASKSYHDDPEKHRVRNRITKSKRKDADAAYMKIYREENKEELKQYQRVYDESRKDNKKQYYQDNKEHIQEVRVAYKENNADKIRETQNEYQRHRRAIDTSYKIDSNVSRAIRYDIKKNGSSKAGLSCWDYLPYTKSELMTHLESLFEPWMTWKNWGPYRVKDWDDTDPSTWTWQIDHIIPRSVFSYTSMKNKAFRCCWALSNLRPLSAKQNILDGVAFTRQGRKREYNAV